MPPTENLTLRMERTHEENQERAYIAASHRTDRSLEARMESARRASEIHKQRTGKFFRITEKAVLAGEVYNDDDYGFPAPYCQLDQQLRADASDPKEFFRRFVDYLSVNANLRRILKSAIEESNNISARNAAEAAAPRRGSTSASSAFQEGPALEGPGPSIQTSPFSPTVFVPPYQGPLLSTAPGSSNPPTPTATVTHSHPQVTMAQSQPPISAQGTQFHMGPLSLGTLPAHCFQGTYLARGQTAPTIRIPQQTSAPFTSAAAAGLPQNPYHSAALTPEQFQALSQTLPSRRCPSDSTVDMVGSPMSDISMRSFEQHRVPQHHQSAADPQNLY
ncbi:uncharacterized protein DFL_003351 [Arthrobotrys flagrans]|uniref:Uncharacterized protein n=1 Tax=Arthrobotrys flagrans TaxID=97331 RepID=A0A437A1L1_ARTFL|nr:hypothetical protein DFL_003351 [Arthrobotrys flagrans]